MKEKISIPNDKVKKIKDICARRKGQRDNNSVIDDLKTFIKTTLKQRMAGIAVKEERGITEYEKSKALYAEYEKFNITPATLHRAFTEEGITRAGDYFHLKELLDLYLEAFSLPEADITNGSIFSEKTIQNLRNRVLGTCSNPECDKPTMKPVKSDPYKVLFLGKACAIYGPHPGSPRYDPTVTVKEDDIENAIWLCIYDAFLVNEDSAEYTATKLKEWKTAREEIIRACIEGRKRITFAFNLHDDQSRMTELFLNFFDNQAALFTDGVTTFDNSQIACAQNISSFLMEQYANVMNGSKLQEKLFSIDAACDSFLEMAGQTGNSRLTAYGFIALKKAIGIELAEVASFYKVLVPENVKTIIPVYMDDSDEDPK